MDKAEAEQANGKYSPGELLGKDGIMTTAGVPLESFTDDPFWGITDRNGDREEAFDELEDNQEARHGADLAEREAGELSSVDRYHLDFQGMER